MQALFTPSVDKIITEVQSWIRATNCEVSLSIDLEVLLELT